MVSFVAGLLVGTYLGIVLMCVLFVARDKEEE